MKKEISNDVLERLTRQSGESADELIMYVEQGSDMDPAFLKSAMKGSFDLTTMRCHQITAVYPTAFIRRTGLYVQGLLDIEVGKSFYTVREGMPSMMLLLTTEGNGRLEYMHKMYELEPGDLFFIDARIMQDYRAAGDKWRYRLIHFDGEMAERYFAPIVEYGNVLFRVENGSPTEEAINEIFRLYNGAFNYHGNATIELRVNLLIQSILTELLLKLPSIDSALLPDWIREVFLWIPEHCTEDLRLDDIALRFSVSKYHLSREFHKHTKRTLIDYWNECRVDKARQLLRSSRAPIGEIAEAVGFHDQETFCRVFRRYEKTSPSKFRKEWDML